MASRLFAISLVGRVLSILRPSPSVSLLSSSPVHQSPHLLASAQVRSKSDSSNQTDTERGKMTKRRLSRIAMSEDEEEENETLSRRRLRRKREEEDEVADEEVEQEVHGKGKEETDSNDEEEAEAKPLGEVVRVSGKGRSRKKHYESFEFDGNQYDLEDPVLLSPAETDQKPYVAIIKDITEAQDGSLSVTGQWFYRPEEAEKKGGGSWQSRDTRELFYSDHHDDVPAESVMHKCVVHFIPLNKQLPKRQEHPGFIVQRVYDTVERKLFKLTDKDYEDNLQKEIDILVQKTKARIGELPEVEEDNTGDQEDRSKTKRAVRKRTISHLDVSREEEGGAKSDQQQKVETPGSCANTASEYYKILVDCNALTGDTHRDRWLEKLLQGVQFVCNLSTTDQIDDKEKVRSDTVKYVNGDKPSETSKVSLENSLKGTGFLWPDAAARAVAALEQASHDSFSSDYLKYNQKMRSMVFNLKNNALLARRLLNGELEPSKILNMSPNELKEGSTAEELAKKEPEEKPRMQMTDARCKRCQERNVGLIDIIQAGHGERYQLECVACGNTWYASRDEVSMLTIGPSNVSSVGTVPLATAKFEDVEKKLLSPRESEKAQTDVFKKTTEAYMPVLEPQKSFNKVKTEETTNPE